jgi:hypothetical protein
VLDDLTPLQQLGEALASDAYLFDVRSATRYVLWSNDGNLGQKLWVGENPPYGAMITYYLKTDARDPITFTISDNAGKSVRTIRNAPRAAGVNRLFWDLRHDGAPLTAITPTEGDQPPGGRGGGAGGGAAGGGEGGGGGGGRGGRGGFAGGGPGPAVIPGDYSVKVQLAGHDFTKPIKVDLDPRANVTTGDLIAQRDAGFALLDLSQRVTVVIDRTNDLIRQLTALVENIRRNAPNEREALAEAEGALSDLRKLRDEKLLRPLPGLGYRQYPRLREEVGSLAGSVNGAVAKPTDAQTQRHGELVAETSQAQQELNGIINGRIAKLNNLLKNLPHVITGGIIM